MNFDIYQVACVITIVFAKNRNIRLLAVALQFQTATQENMEYGMFAMKKSNVKNRTFDLNVPGDTPIYPAINSTSNASEIMVPRTKIPQKDFHSGFSP